MIRPLVLLLAIATATSAWADSAKDFAGLAIDTCLSGRQPAAMIGQRLEKAGWRPVAASRTALPGTTVLSDPAGSRLATLHTASGGGVTLVTCSVYDTAQKTAAVASAIEHSIGIKLNESPMSGVESLFTYVDQGRNQTDALFSVKINIGRGRAPDEAGRKQGAKPLMVQIVYIPSGGNS